MKLVLKAVLVGGDPQPLTVGTQVERDRERLALYHAPRDAHADGARAVLAVRAEWQKLKCKVCLLVNLHSDR